VNRGATEARRALGGFDDHSDLVLRQNLTNSRILQAGLCKLNRQIGSYLTGFRINELAETCKDILMKSENVIEKLRAIELHSSPGCTV
jgi:hypothetical protein